MTELLIGCGNDRKKKITFEGIDSDWHQLTTLDIDPSTKPDVVHDLNVLPYPFKDDEFDEIHAYEVLEHCGRQGDWKYFLDQFAEFWRILRPNGYLIGSCPMWDGPWAWSDPGHTRIISRQSLVFLSQAEYANQIGKTSMTDYRPWYKADFQIVALTEKGDTFGFVLQAIK
jgi:SAM-dependent methyltransferase